jgi:hypothetical protein
MLIKKVQGPAQFVPFMNCVIGTEWVKVEDGKGKALLEMNPLYIAKEEPKKVVQVTKTIKPPIVEKVFTKEKEKHFAIEEDILKKKFLGKKVEDILEEKDHDEDHDYFEEFTDPEVESFRE